MRRAFLGGHRLAKQNEAETAAAALREKPAVLCAGSEALDASATLHRAGYNVGFVNNGNQAWRWMITAPFDLALVPLGLRGLDGIRLTERLRLLWVATPVLLLSEVGNPFTRAEANRLGIVGVLPKDCASHVLLAAAASALADRSKPNIFPGSDQSN